MLSQDKDLTGLTNPTELILWYDNHPVIEVHSASKTLCTLCILQAEDSIQHNIHTVMSQIKPQLLPSMSLAIDHLQLFHH